MTLKAHSRSGEHFSSAKTVPATALSGKTISGIFTCFSVIDQLHTFTDLCLPITTCRQKAIILSQLNLSHYCPILDYQFFHIWVLLLSLREKNDFYFQEKIKCFLNTMFMVVYKVVDIFVLNIFLYSNSCSTSESSPQKQGKIIWNQSIQTIYQIYHLAFGVVNALTEVKVALSLPHLEIQGSLWQLFPVESIPNAPEARLTTAAAWHTSVKRHEFLLL